MERCHTRSLKGRTLLGKPTVAQSCLGLGQPHFPATPKFKENGTFSELGTYICLPASSSVSSLSCLVEKSGALLLGPFKPQYTLMNKDSGAWQVRGGLERRLSSATQSQVQEARPSLTSLFSQLGLAS